MVDDKPRKFSQEDIATMRDLVSWAQTEVNLTQLSEVQVQLISELDQAQHEAKTDGLTGLWNQAAIKDILYRAHHRHLITQQPYSIMMIDIDNFKDINDTHGHPFGDQVLKAIATELKTSLRPSDAIGRYGGDEFLIILENCPYARAEELSQRILQHNHQLTIINNNDKIKSTVSIGYSATDNIEVDSSEALLEHADQGLYQAKHSGRDCAKG
jgi:diguanylate cyclase (GGDEF)-like protein